MEHIEKTSQEGTMKDIEEDIKNLSRKHPDDMYIPTKKLERS